MDSMDDAQKKPTIRDVARLAGVSYGTVSRYLNGNTHVSQDAAERIAAAITKSQYTPNNAARSLAQRRTLTVALIIQVESNETIARPVCQGRWPAPTRSSATRATRWSR